MLLTFPVISQLKDGTDCWNLPSRTTRTCLTHWGRDKMAAILQKTFSNAFSWIKMYEFQFKFHLSLLLRVQLTIFHHWFRQWLGTNQVPSHYLNQWWLDYQRIYICHSAAMSYTAQSLLVWPSSPEIFQVLAQKVWIMVWTGAKPFLWPIVTWTIWLKSCRKHFEMS